MFIHSLEIIRQRDRVKKKKRDEGKIRQLDRVTVESDDSNKAFTIFDLRRRVRRGRRLRRRDILAIRKRGIVIR